MTLLAVKAFSGLKPISNPRMLGTNEAQTAQNVRLISGALSPLKGTTTLKPLVLTSPPTIFRYGNSATETDYWLEFSQDTDVMRSPIAADQFDRLYWTNGENKPRYAPNSLILQAGTGAYPRASYELGIPKPSTAAAITSSTAVVTYTTVTREYVLTHYNPTTLKESLPGSVISVQAVDGQKVAFTNLPTDNLGDPGITKLRIYRKVSTTYRRIVELNLGTTTYDDTTTDATAAGLTALVAASASAMPTPTRAPTVSAAAATTTSGIAREYVYTIKNFSVLSIQGDNDYYNYYNESAPSTVRSVSADATQTVTLGNFTNNLSGTAYRIYRRDAGSSQYLFVAEIPTNQSTFADVIATTQLGAPLNYDGPTASVPSTQPSGSVNSSTATAALNRIYMVTFLNAAGNESGEGPSSTVINVNDGQAVTIVHTESVPAGVTRKRVYRQNVTISSGVMSTSDANWRLIADGPSSATSTIDTTLDANAATGAFSSTLRDLPAKPTGTPTVNATIPPKKVPESRTYVFTYVSTFGEEGPPSDASAVVELDPELPVTVSCPGGAPVANVTLKRIYRSSTVGSRASFQFVAEIPVATTSYVDSVTQANLGEVLPSENWVGPPAGLKGLRLMANGAAVGFVGKTVYFSEPNLPHAWPHQYTVDEEIVGIATYGQTVAVLTKAYPYLFQGIDPAAMSSTKMPLPQACSSKQSIVETGDGVLYASEDGLVSIGSGISVLTQNIYSRDQWQALNPDSMKCFIYNGRVIVFYTTSGGSRGTLLMDVSGQGALLTTTNINALTAVHSGFYDPKTDILYLALGTNIVRFDSGSNLTMLWRSKDFRLPFPESLTTAQVRAEAYPVEFRLYADGVLRHAKTVNSGEQFRLPSGFRGLDWEFEIEGSNEVSEVLISSSSVELRAA